MSTLLLQVAMAGLLSGGLAVLAALLVLPRPAPTGVDRGLRLVADTGTGDPRQARLQASLVDRLLGTGTGTLARLGRRLTPVGTPERLRRRLDLAGNPAGWSLETLFACKAVGTVVLGSCGIAFLLLTRSATGLFLAAALVAGGYWITDILLYNAGLKRQEGIRRAAPDALDMLTVCVEAGLGFDAALSQVARNSKGPLAAEFARMLQELQLGRSRTEAFQDLAARTTAPELKMLVAAFVQADRLGVPIAGVLREQSTDMRLRRRQRAEERAQKVPIKILFPLLLCIFPAFFVVVIGPGIIQIVRTFSQM